MLTVRTKQLLSLVGMLAVLPFAPGCSSSEPEGAKENDDSEMSQKDSDKDDESEDSSDEDDEDSSSDEDDDEDDDEDSSSDESSTEDETSSKSDEDDSSSESEDDDTDESTESTEESDSSDTSETDDSSTDMDDPIVLYKEVCAECHGEQGEGVADKGYELQHPTRDYFDWVTRNGREGLGFPEEMPSYDELTITDEQLNAIWDYLDSPPKPTTGEAIYADYCASCHGEDGKGGVVGVSANHSEPGFTFHVQQGFPDAPFGDRAGYMPAYDSSWLSTAELATMKEYLDSIGAF